MVNVNKWQQGKVMSKVKVGSIGLPVYLLPYLAEAYLLLTILRALKVLAF